MCSNNDDNELQMISDTQKPGILEQVGDCKKCKKYAELFYQLGYREVECRECFLLYVRHKFRATLASNRVLPRDAHVLLYFDGTPESIMLLDIMHHAITQNAFKRLQCTAKVICLADDTLDLCKLQQVDSFIKSYEIFDTFLGTYNEHSKLVNLQPIAETMYEVEKFKIPNIKTLTSQQDFIYEQKKRVLLDAAKQLDCQSVFVPDTSTSLATRLLTAITLGRGGSAAMDVELLDERGKSYNEVLLIRPMKDINVNEVNLYLHARNLQELKFSITAYGRQLGPHASLLNLTQSFIENLQNNSPATVSTVYRTGTKINGCEKLESVHKCDFCLADLDVQNSKTLEAIEFSSLASVAGNTIIDGNMQKEIINQQVNHIFDNLCHGCKNIYRDKF